MNITQRSTLLTFLTLLVACQPAEDPDPIVNESPPTEVVLTETGRTLFVLEADADPMLMLTAIPAAHATSGGHPAVLALNPNEITAPTEDYLKRYQPEQAWQLGTNRDLPHTQRSATVEGGTPAGMSATLATTLWDTAPDLVLVDHSAYTDGLIAAPFAAKHNAPLLLVDPSDPPDFASLASNLALEQLWVVGDLSIESDLPTTYLADATAVIDAMGEVNYLAATNPADADSDSFGGLSLLAPLIAARRGGAVFDLPADPELSANEATEALHAHFDAYGLPDHLALVGGPTHLPFHDVKNPLWDERLMTDAPYVEVDDDPFADTAIGRLVANNLVEGSLLTSRISTYDLLIDDKMRTGVAFTGSWYSPEVEPALENVGFDDRVWYQKDEIDALRALNVSAIVHSDHSACWALGNAFDLNTTTLLAPSVITSNGCATAGIDTGGPDESVATHLLYLGAVAYLGGPRNVTSQTTQAIVAFWNEVTAGATMGQAFQRGYNSLAVNVLDNPDDATSKYSKRNLVLYGDPAMTMAIPDWPYDEPAGLLQDGDTLTVRPPVQWSQSQLDDHLKESEWGYYDTELFYYAAPGIEPHSYWAGRYDEQVSYLLARYTSEEPVDLILTSDSESPLGELPPIHRDSHPDGSETLIWRIQMLDYEWETGDILGELQDFSYEIVATP
jgi:hypothetical protein